MQKRHKTTRNWQHGLIRNSIFIKLCLITICGAVGVMFLHLNVIILTARDAGRLQAISGQKKKQTPTRF